MSKKTASTIIVEIIYLNIPLIFGSLLVTALLAINVSLRPYLLKLILDRIADSSEALYQNLDNIEKLAALYIALVLARCGLDSLKEFFSTKLVVASRNNTAEGMMSRLLEHSLKYFQDQFSGSLAGYVKETMHGAADIILILINGYFRNTIALFIAFLTLWQSSPEISLLLGAWSVIFILCSYIFSFNAINLSRKLIDSSAQFTGRMVDILGSISSVILFSGKRYEFTKFKILLQEYSQNFAIRDFYFIKSSAVKNLSFIVYQAACLYFLVTGLKTGKSTAGDFALVIIINSTILDILFNISIDIDHFSKSLGEVNQALKTIYQPLDIVEAENPTELVINSKPVKDTIEILGDNSLLGGKISFQDVSFSYDAQRPLFRDLSVTINPGTKTGLVGYSGSGKTSFVNLLLRLYEVDAGLIMIDDQDISTVTLESLRRNISLIPQDPALFHRTLEENIKYGVFDSSNEAVIEAARNARADEFIEALPDKYSSTVGERGIKLSGGQKQRIAIARCILKNAPILIMDEATSSLDSLTESYIQESLLEIMQSKTTIIIAHRLSTLLHMDRILVFDNGKIVEDGMHQELLEKGGLYNTLWETQVGGFLPQVALGK